MQKSMFGVLAETEDRISCRCFNFKSAWLRSPASPSLCSKSFLFLSHASSMPWKSQSQVGALPVSPPGQRAPSHMPCRLARSSTPLNWLIATQEKGGKKNSNSVATCCQCEQIWSSSKRDAHLPPLPVRTLIKPSAPIPGWLPASLTQAAPVFACCKFCKWNQTD